MESPPRAYHGTRGHPWVTKIRKYVLRLAVITHLGSPSSSAFQLKYAELTPGSESVEDGHTGVFSG
jgi:hypothetical protein